MKKFLAVSVLVSTISVLASASGKLPVISEKTLLKEMLDKNELARLPAVAYESVQFSSYDRASVSPEKPGWYANNDYSQFISTDKYDDRTENVMMDIDGPGAVVRSWVTLGDDENGILRIYIDGSEKPVIEGNVMDVLSGDIVADAPLADSVSPETNRDHRGHDLYYPIPFAKHCKITYQSKNERLKSFYYCIACRKYVEPCEVISFTGEKDKELSGLVAEVNEILKAPAAALKGSSVSSISCTLGPDQENSLVLKGSKAINHMTFKLSAEDINQAFRSTVLSIEFDGEQTVWVPVGDFCGVGYSNVFHRTFFNASDSESGLSCSWVMPFEHQCRVTLHNYGSQEVEVEGSVSYNKWAWDSRSLHFGACWYQLADYKTGTCNRADPKDVNFVSLRGKGKYVGDNLAIFHTTGSWWGEGDEKIYIDGSGFPDMFGTGTEDYYGYAWCNPNIFPEHPFVTMPIGSGNFGSGCTVNNRYRSLDAITFNESLVFDMEIYSWNETRIYFAPTAYWYMRPGGTFNKTPDIPGVKEKVMTSREQFLKPVLSFYIEGEDMTLENMTGGQTYIKYDGSVTYYSACRYICQASEGNRVTLSFDSIVDADVKADAIMVTAPDYATVNLFFNGVEVADNVNLHSVEVSSNVIPMGSLHLQKGKNTLEIEIVDAGDSDQNGNYGLDRLSFYLK